MVLKAEQQRVRALLAEAVTVLCKNGLTFSSELCVEGLIGITLDRDDVFLVNIKETFNSLRDSFDQNSDHEVSQPKKTRFATGIKQESQSKSQSIHSSTKQSYFARQHVARARKRATTPKCPPLYATSTPIDTNFTRNDNDNTSVQEDTFPDNDQVIRDEIKPEVEHLIKAEPQEEDDEDDVLFVKEEASQRTTCMSYQDQRSQRPYHDRSSSLGSDHPANSSIVHSQYSNNEGDSHHPLQDISQMSDYSNLAGCSNWDQSTLDLQSGQFRKSGPLLPGQQQQSLGRIGGDQQSSQQQGDWINQISTRKQVISSLARTYQCEHCSGTFLYRRSYSRHLKEQHSSKRLYRCYKCSRYLRSAEDRRTHNTVCKSMKLSSQNIHFSP